jgi:hypothetical protein
MAVQHGVERPADAYASIRYRDQWFWIDDRDQRSKQTFSFLLLMFTLTESAPTQSTPVVTVPAR